MRRFFAATLRRFFAATLLALAGCTATQCEVENLPYQGHPTDPEQLFRLAQHAARNECDDTLYGLLSKRTRDEHGSFKFGLFWGSLKLPEPWEYRVKDVVSKGLYHGVLPDPLGRLHMYVEYQEPGKPDLLAELYIVYEQDEEGRKVPRLALQDQLDTHETRDPILFAQPPSPMGPGK